MQLHLDPIGGIAGDMFIAALLDAFPELEAGVLESINAVDIEPAVTCRLLSHHDGTLRGRQFSVAISGAGSTRDEALAVGEKHASDMHQSHPRESDRADRQDLAEQHDANGAHTPWRVIQARLEDSTLTTSVKRHALGIFTRLAEAEGRVHGIPAEEVTFHEVGAFDSIADIVGAAYLIAELNPSRWTFAPIPLGSGRIRTAHGIMPAPAPATADLLRGLATIDDGVVGERITPTGAAIVRHLIEFQTSTSTEPRTLRCVGVGFGTRTLAGMSNCLRVLAFDESADYAKRGDPQHRELAVIEFEVDDQAGEEMAMGLERLRAHPDIFDATQAPVFGKKGRLMTHVQILARPGALDEARAACFRETTTIGLRYRIVKGYALARCEQQVEVDGRRIRVKIVARPDGPTAKAEADDVLASESHTRRIKLRAEAERRALAMEPAYEPHT